MAIWTYRPGGCDWRDGIAYFGSAIAQRKDMQQLAERAAGIKV